MPITGFVDTSSPHSAKNHIRLGEMKSLWKAARGGGKRPATFDRRNNDHFMFLIELVQDAPITNPAAKRAVETLKEFNVTPERVLAHF